MDQHGSSGISDSDSSAGSSTHRRPHPHDPDYPFDAVTGPDPSSHFYTHPARTSILSANGGLALDPVPGLASADRRRDRNNNNMDDDGDGAMNDGWRRGSLPSFSRGFDMFMAPPSTDHDPSTPLADDFFVPSYLADSTFVRKLMEAHKAKAEAQREIKLSSLNGSIANGTGFSQQPLPAGTHRGMSHHVVERPPPFEEDDELSPLPTRWNRDDMWGGIEILSDGRSVEYTGPRNPHERDHEASAVRADHYMPPQCGIYYFEVNVMYGKRDDTTIAVGFSTRNASTSRPVGWEPESWAYHGDDGRCFTGQNIGRPYAPTFSTGDVIGCGVNFRDHTAFFTKNGVHLGVAFHDLARGKLYPTVSLKKPREHIFVNFGQAPFVYDIDTMMRHEKQNILADIDNTDISSLEPGLSETDLIHALVLQFLQHDGYVETARAFAEDIKQQREALRLDPNVTVDGINIKDDEDANNRQRIRRAILQGDIDRALKLTNAYYPQVLHDNEEVHFKLRCRKFIELVRGAAQLRTRPAQTNNTWRKATPSQSMDVDSNGADSTPWNGKNAEVVESQPDMLKLEQEMLDYGQTLGAEYANDARPEISKALGEIWALVAYANPLKEPKVSHLLDEQGRVTVAEELNSAILSSLGKSSRASLEKLFAQTSVLLEDLRTDGGSGAFVAVQDVVGMVAGSVPPTA